MTQVAEFALIEKRIHSFKEDGWMFHESTQNLREQSISLNKIPSTAQTDVAF